MSRAIGPIALAVLTCLASHAIAADDQVTLVGWGGTSQDAITEAVAKPFTEQSGIKVQEDVTDGNYAKVKAMVDSKNVTWDVLTADAYYPIGNCGTYAEKIDTSVVDTSKLIAEMVTPCAVPLYQYGWVLVYNTDKYGSNPPKSWADFFDTKKYPGKRAMYNQAFAGTLEVPLLADGVAPDKIWPLDYDRAFKKLNSLGDDLIFFDTGAQQQQMLESGEADMAVAWTTRAYNAAANGAKIKPVWNQPIAAYDTLMVLKGSPHKDAAMKLIAYATGAEAQTKLPNKTAFAPVNVDAKPKVDPLKAEWLLSTHKDVPKIVMNMAWYAKNQEEAVKRFTDWQSSR
ncbi:ABC transporter substrate-binding protein (plasmid) [Mesorhizobium sp. 131-3-5]|uniref:ABC transporter substrate-binding protein n=1 Tax=Mesorhizobium sp. 131-3-5 TaxID=2744520 RepID=UPI0018EE025C|nr:ABC transporter substrate-binding protein [Mesorhizobium sp. 131-3-5]BCH12337.1 ABC transporter substrate-binding protein [Mesorhizobium sp. 131-3-5]